MSDLITTQNGIQTINGRSDQNPARVYLAGLDPGSRRAMTQALNVIAEIIAGSGSDFTGIPWHRLEFQHTAAIRAELAERYAHTTANKMLSALRGTLKAAWQLGLMDSEAYAKATAVANVKGERLPAGRDVPIGEVVALLNTCEQTAVDVRDAAIIAIMYGCGLRRAELIALNMSDYDNDAGTLRIQGKRNKQRQVPIVNGAARALNDWLTIRGDMPGAVFVGLGNRNNGRRLTKQAIYDMLQRRADTAGIASLSPHDFRRTFVGELLDRGADIVTVQKLAGHANVNTTARYDRRGETAKRKAAELIHVPYTGRVLT